MSPPLEDILTVTPLFKGLTSGDVASLLPLLSPTFKEYDQEDCLLAAGSASDHIGIVLAGTIEAVKYTRAGGQFTVAQMGPGGVFGDVLASGRTKSPVTVRATAPCTAMFIGAGRLFHPPGTHLDLFCTLLANLASVTSEKYFALDRRIDLLLIHGLKKRLAAYLLDAGRDSEGRPFTIPFNRAALASYLGCERSALSREISALAKSGLITTKRSAFTIPDPPALKALF